MEPIGRRSLLVVVTGDIHAAGIARLHHDLEDVSTERIGTELVGTSVSSTFPVDDQAEVAETLVGQLPYVEYINVRQRGYTVVDLTADSMRYEYKVVADPTVQGSAVSTAHTGEVSARALPDEPPEDTPAADPAVPVDAPASFTG